MENKDNPLQPGPKDSQQPQDIRQPTTKENNLRLPEIHIDETDEARKKADQALLKRLVVWYKARKKWTIPLSILLVLVMLGLLPWTRYEAAGLVLKKDITITVKDSILLRPVSGAEVSYGNMHVLTDANGRAVLHHLRVGEAAIHISKKYYQDENLKLLVPISSIKSQPVVRLVATGRQIPVKITDYIDGRPVRGVTINVSGTSAQTDSSGNAVLVVPAGISVQEANATDSGYNDTKFNIHPNAEDTGSPLKISMTPAGNIYYFSKASGKLDLMKANLDGSSAQVVLPGTGYEQDSNSEISISPDGKYIAMTLQRTASDTTAQLYIMSAADDKLLSVDSGSEIFTIQGWWGDNLIYTSSRTSMPDWQTGKNKLKAYEATTGKITLLDQSAGINDTTGSAGETYGFVTIINGSVIYAKNWTVDSGTPATPDSLNTIDVDGQNYKMIVAYDGEKYTMSYSQHSAKAVYIWQQDNNNYTSSGSFFDYQVGDSGPKPVNINSDTFYSSSKAFLPSASGDKVLWSDYRNGNNDILITDLGSGDTTTVSQDGYAPLGWYTDKYVLVTSNSTLYVISSGGGEAHEIAAYQVTGY